MFSIVFVGTTVDVSEIRLTANQLRLVVHPCSSRYLHGFSTIPGGCFLGFLKINSITSLKINMEPKNYPIEKKNPLNQSCIFKGVQNFKYNLQVELGYVFHPLKNPHITGSRKNFIPNKNNQKFIEKKRPCFQVPPQLNFPRWKKKTEISESVCRRFQVSAPPLPVPFFWPQSLAPPTSAKRGATCGASLHGGGSWTFATWR